MARIILSVTWSDINLGLQGDCLDCPIALSLKRRLKDGIIPDVSGETICLLDDNGPAESVMTRTVYEVKTPEIASSFINSFDFCRFGQAFRFPLDIPDKFLKPR